MNGKIILSLLGLTLLGNASDFFYENGKKIEVKELTTNNSRVEKTRNKEDEIRYFKTSSGHKIGVKNDILVKCIESVDCNQTLSKYETLSVTQLSNTIFIVNVSPEKNLFEFSQHLYADENISLAHPNFRKKKERR